MGNKITDETISTRAWSAGTREASPNADNSGPHESVIDPYQRTQWEAQAKIVPKIFFVTILNENANN